MANDLKRRLQRIEMRTGNAVTVSAGDIALAIARYRSEARSPRCPSADRYGLMLRSMKPATAVLFLHIHPEDLLL